MIQTSNKVYENQFLPKYLFAYICEYLTKLNKSETS